MKNQLSRTKIHVTNDYNLFTIRKTNRPVLDSYMRELAEEIRKRYLTDNFPIVVTENMEIVDGQHRYFACMELGLPIKYTIITGEFKSREIDDITVGINSHQRVWRLNEFVELYSKRKIPSYMAVVECMERYGMPISNALVIVGAGRVSPKDVRDGKFESGDLNWNEVSRNLLDIKKIFPDAMHAKFVSAFVAIMNHKLYDHKLDYGKLVLYRMDMQKCATVEQYIKMLETILNKRRRGGKLDFSIAEPKTAMEG